ncbi:hypothetical protein [Nibricoccus sp. IMCC34717]|uniref:hypothetical protein n=1 Tax=Nibricoccus sp. IMCC34717 TaxID=3034021 RepID=UPI0038516B73
MDTPAPLHPNPKVAEALSFIQAAENSLQAGTPQGADWALQQYGFAIDRLRVVSPESAEFRRMLALAVFSRANAIVRKGGDKALAEATPQFDEALSLLRSSGFEDKDVIRNDEANVWMAQAQALAGLDGANRWRDAIAALDSAIALRREIAGGKHPEVNHAIAVAWTNRAEILARAGVAENQEEIVRSFREAIAIMQALPYQEHDGLRHQLASTLMNLGIAEQGGAEGVQRALARIEECIALVEGQNLVNSSEGRHLLACALLNRGGLKAALPGANPPEVVAAAAREVLALLNGHEDEQPQVSEVALRARIFLVRAGGDVLDRDPSKAPTAEAVAELTDAVDDGLTLVKSWEKRGLAAFRPMAAELFIHGVQLYRKHQPQFLAEYAIETLDTARSPEALGGVIEMYQAALDAITRTIAANQNYSFASIGDEATARRLEMLKELREAEARLREMIRPQPQPQGRQAPQAAELPEPPAPPAPPANN